MLTILLLAAISLIALGIIKLKKEGDVSKEKAYLYFKIAGVCFLAFIGGTSESLWSIIGVMSFALIFIALIWLVVTFIRKKDHKKSLYLLIAAVFLFFAEIIVVPTGNTDSTSNDTAKTTVAKEESKKTKETKKKVESISAVYNGKTIDGTVLNSSSLFTVTAKYEDGTESNVTGWKIDTPTTLAASQTSTVTITYKGISTDVSVECTTLSEEAYKSQCESISYDELARNDQSYLGKKIKFRGKVIQVMGTDSITMRIEVTEDSYGLWDDVVMVDYFYKEGQSKFLEDDIVTFYGEYEGLYSYTSVMGAKITVPSCNALYIDR